MAKVGVVTWQLPHSPVVGCFESNAVGRESPAAVAVLGFRAADPTGYGRLLMQGDRLIAIREHADASEEEVGKPKEVKLGGSLEQVTLTNPFIAKERVATEKKLAMM